MDKNKIMMVVIIALLVLLLGVIGGGVFVLTNTLKNINGESGSQEQPANANRLSQSEIVTIDYDTAVKAIYNDQETKKAHAVTFYVSVGLDNSDKKKEKDLAALQSLMQERKTVVMSYVNEIVYQHDSADFSDSLAIQSSLSAEILEKLQTEFGSNLIYQVYISGYLYQ
ncbi:MAG: hypothetical protein LBU36_03730 [Clostridiales bacterium]|nr:hypothetical protein [Clostridiales bacterium]